MNLSSWFTFLFVYLSLLNIVRAQDYDDVETEDDIYHDRNSYSDNDGSADPSLLNKGDSSGFEVNDEKYQFSDQSPPGLDSYAVFSEYKEENIPAGVPLRILVGFRNVHEKMNYKVRFIFASFHYPKMMSHYMQNFSVYRYDHVISSGHSRSLAYSFWPSDGYTDVSVGIIVRALIRDQNATEFITVAYNQTVKLTESLHKSFDFQMLFLMITLLLILGSTIYYFFSASINKKVKALRNRAITREKVESGTEKRTNEGDLSWIPKETADLHIFNKRHSAQPRKR